MKQKLVCVGNGMAGIRTIEERGGGIEQRVVVEESAADRRRQDPSDRELTGAGPTVDVEDEAPHAIAL